MESMHLVERSLENRNMKALTMLISLISLLAVGSEQQPGEIFLQWSLTLDADGHIQSLTSLSSGKSKQLAEQLDPTIRRWHFTPGNINGRPAETDTTLTVRVALDDAGGSNYRVRVVSAMTGARYENGPVPAYPLAAMRMGRYGEVNIEVTHDAAGRVLSATVLRPMGPHVDSILVRAALDAIKKASFRPETVGGHGVAGSAIASICFSLEGHDDPCFWTTPHGDTEQVDTTRPFPTSSVARVRIDDAG
jgi:TonB family protein